MGKRGASPPPPAGGGDDRLIELTRRLAAVAAELGLSEIEVESAGTRLRVQRAGAAPAPATHMVAAPATDPFVREGDVVKEGQILCIIEAMKLMNEIESKAAGRVLKVLVENGQPVEYGQPLFLLEPPH